MAPAVLLLRGNVPFVLFAIGRLVVLALRRFLCICNSGGLSEESKPASVLSSLVVLFAKVGDCGLTRDWAIPSVVTSLSELFSDACVCAVTRDWAPNSVSSSGKTGAVFVFVVFAG
jgi:hypothetical protein